MKNKTCGECRFHHQDYHYCKADKECKSIYPENLACENFKLRTTTNGDKIRQMSDEELAELLADNTCTDCGFFGIGQDGVEICTMTVKDTCKDGKLAWLKQEAKDE